MKNCSLTFVFDHIFLQFFIIVIIMILLEINVEGEMPMPVDHALRFADYQYPEYCTKIPLDPSSRQSEPLNLIDQKENYQLRQVQVIFRHGARTPASLEHCWKGYNPIWDCEYNEETQGICPTIENRNLNLDSDLSTLIFRKLYDAEQTQNVFHGTCEKGQLLLEGALQHREIGRLLAESYFNSDSPHKIPYVTSPPLFLFNDDINTSIYFRSTDMQRSRLSGANLLTSLLSTAFNSSETFNIKHITPVTLHTLDIENDYMLQNHAHCPALIDAGHRAMSHPDFIALLNKSEILVKTLENIILQPLPSIGWPYQILDCLMTHICADRWDMIPEGLRPNSLNPNKSREILNNVIEAVDEQTAFVYLFNNSEFSKFGTSHFMRTLRNSLTKIIEGSDTAISLNLWSGHDTTLMPFLGSLGSNVWDKKWPAYASIVIIELFEKTVNNSGINQQTFWFRLLLNGKSVTQGINGCLHKDVCEIQNFFEFINWTDAFIEECEKPEMIHESLNHFVQDIQTFVWPSDRIFKTSNMYYSSIKKISYNKLIFLFGWIFGTFSTLIIFRYLETINFFNYRHVYQSSHPYVELLINEKEVTQENAESVFIQ